MQGFLYQQLDRSSGPIQHPSVLPIHSMLGAGVPIDVLGWKIGETQNRLDVQAIKSTGMHATRGTWGNLSIVVISDLQGPLVITENISALVGKI